LRTAGVVAMHHYALLEETGNERRGHN
jgi:hypothetical protein